MSAFAYYGMWAMAIVGGVGTAGVFGDMAWCFFRDWLGLDNYSHVKRMTEPGEWPEEFDLRASECHREGRRTGW